MINSPITIEHPSNVSMRHSEGVINYLIKRKNKQKPFLLGHWLTSLDDGALNSLRDLTKRFMDGAPDPGHTIDDVISVAIHAYLAETGQFDMNVEMEFIPELVRCLHFASTLDFFRRKGLIEVLAPLSIRPDSSPSIQLTKSGLQQAEQIKSMMH